MNNWKPVGCVLSLMLMVSTVSAQGILFSDTFDSVDSESAYEIKAFEHADDPDGFQHFWEFTDYSGYGIPSAPNSDDESTSGLVIFVNVGGLAAADVVNFFTQESYSGNIRASVDVYMNFVPETAGTTEFFGMGMYPSGDLLIAWEGFTYAPEGNDLPSQADGYYFAMDGDGDSGTRGDYFFSEGFPDGSLGAGFQCGQWQTANAETVSDCRVLLGVNSADNDPFFAELFPAGEANHYIGSPGNRWVTVTMEYINGTITVSLNGTLVHTYTDPDLTYSSGKVMLAYEDAFGSAAGENSFCVLDNFLIEQIDVDVEDWSLLE